MRNTVELHRVFTSTPDKIWRAFTQPDAFARWLPPNGFTAHVHAMDLKVGGAWRMHFTNFTTNTDMHFGGKYLELRENEAIAYTATTSLMPYRRQDGKIVKWVWLEEKKRDEQDNIPYLRNAQLNLHGDLYHWSLPLGKARTGTGD